MAQSKPIAQGIDITERKLSEEKLVRLNLQNELILSSAAEGILGLDLQGNHTFVNPAAARMLGYEVEELLGRPSHSTWHHTKPDGSPYPKEECEIYTAYRDGAVHRASTEVFWRKDGTSFPVEYASTPIYEQDRLVGAVVTFADITERKQAEEKLIQSEKRYRTNIESIDDGYFEVDLAGTFTYVNDAQCSSVGTPREQLLGKNNRAYTSEEEAKKLYQLFSGIYKTGEPVTGFAFEYKRKDGTMAYNEMSVSLIRDPEGKPIGFRGISRDVSERKKAEEQLKRYAAELERSNEEVKNFAYIVSHDLRVPLINLKGYTSELRSALEVIGSNLDAALPHLIDEKRSAVATALHEDVPEALEFITNSVSRMDSFINAVLILARLGRQDLKPEPIDMNALVQTTVETMSHQLQERGIEVIVGSLPQVVADRIAMEQILGNILGNAVKYLDSSRPGRIEVTAQANGAETTFRIRDNGRGIAAEDMDKVFAPFRRAGKQDIQGEGMGLAYVQTLVRRHGGRISCESEIGKGTTFTFTISTRSEKGARDA